MKILSLIKKTSNKVQILLLTILLTILVYYDVNFTKNRLKVSPSNDDDHTSNSLDQWKDITVNKFQQRLDSFSSLQDDIVKKNIAKLNSEESHGNIEEFNDLKTESKNDVYVPTIESMLSSKFTPVDQIKSQTEDDINLGFIMINLNKTQGHDIDSKFRKMVRRTFFTMLQHWESSPLNLIIVSDELSIPSVARLLAHILMREASLRLITTKSKRWRRVENVPKVKVHFVDALEIAAKNKPFIKRLQQMTLQYKENKTVDDDRYLADLFYIAPLYHLALTGLDNLIVMDATDLEFTGSVESLHQQFNHVQNGKLIGIGLDLSSNYFINLNGYRSKNRGSDLGTPGDKQGFNTGVVLYNLIEMRKSSLYNKYLTPDMVTLLHDKYRYDYTLAEQDWFTNLYYSHPSLFHILPCYYNRQTSVQYLMPPFEDVFEDFHKCEPKSQVVIFHSNGCGPSPESCNIYPDSSNYTGQYWKTHKQYSQDSHLEMCGMWINLHGLPDPISYDSCLQYSF